MKLLNSYIDSLDQILSVEKPNFLNYFELGYVIV